MLAHPYVDAHSYLMRHAPYFYCRLFAIVAILKLVDDYVREVLNCSSLFDCDRLAALWMHS